VMHPGIHGILEIYGVTAANRIPLYKRVTWPNAIMN
jgi:hypothetical protein